MRRRTQSRRSDRPSDPLAQEAPVAQPPTPEEEGKLQVRTKAFAVRENETET